MNINVSNKSNQSQPGLLYWSDKSNQSASSFAEEQEVDPSGLAYQSIGYDAPRAAGSQVGEFQHRYHEDLGQSLNQRRKSDNNQRWYSKPFGTDDLSVPGPDTVRTPPKPPRADKATSLADHLKIKEVPAGNRNSSDNTLSGASGKPVPLSRLARSRN